MRSLIPKNIPISQTEDYVLKALEHYSRFLRQRAIVTADNGRRSTFFRFPFLTLQPLEYYQTNRKENIYLS